MVLQKKRIEVVDQLLNDAKSIKNRLEKGIESLQDKTIFEAFRLTNKSMYDQAAQRLPIALNMPLEKIIEQKKPISWRPFQLAFVIINLTSIAEPENKEREIVDLLFFPTGGGKTEAYLGLAAYTLYYRRLANDDIESAGTSIIMRYTLRLLTLDQLSRASALICAMEIERASNPTKLGHWPFEIGLWVGMAATPNKLGSKKSDKGSAFSIVADLKNDRNVDKPLPLENCPWCDHPFDNKMSFDMSPPKNPKRLLIKCANRECHFYKGDGAHLPIIAVDEEIYRRLPCFIIATVDKFASMPFEGKIGGLFGKVQRYDSDGFYGPMEPNIGRPLSNRNLLPRT